MNGESNTGGSGQPVRAAFVDHLTIRVSDLEASRRFYRAALGPWGSREIQLGSGEVSFGPVGSEDLAIAEGDPTGRSISPSRRPTARPSVLDPDG